MGGLLTPTIFLNMVFMVRQDVNIANGVGDDSDDGSQLRPRDGLPPINAANQHRTNKQIAVFVAIQSNSPESDSSDPGILGVSTS